MTGECGCCLTVQPDVHPLGELGDWCATCATTPGGCLSAAADDLVDRDMGRAASRHNVNTWARSDLLHKQLGSTVRNHDKAWIPKPVIVLAPANPVAGTAYAGWWHALTHTTADA